MASFGRSSSLPPLILDEINRELQVFVEKNEIIFALVSDREGASIARVKNQNSLNADGKQLILDQNLAQKIMSAAENIQKLGLGERERVTVEYDHFQLISFFFGKVVVSLVASNNVATGFLTSLEPDCNKIGQSLNDYIE